jgi:hypothetical protein
VRDPTLVAGLVLRTKVEGWKFFCERMGVPSFARWGVAKPLAGAPKPEPRYIDL